MREKKILQVASNTNYATGPRTGFPTKVPPPSVNVTDGAVPGSKYAAEWINYHQHYWQKQIECSAQIPFRNFTELTEGGLYTTTPPKCAYHPQLGATLFVGGETDTAQYLQDFPDLTGGTALRAIAFTPAVGNFVPKCVAAVNDPNAPKWCVGGNATLGTNLIFEVDALGATTELTHAAVAEVANMAVDRTTGILYALAGTSVLARDAGTGAWTVIGSRSGGGSPAASATTFFAVGNGVAIVAYNNGTHTTYDYMTLTPTFAKNGVVTIDADSAVYDACYSPQLGAFMILAPKGLYVINTPGGSIQTFANSNNDPSSPPTADGGVLTDSGCVTWLNSINVLYVRSWPGDAAHALKYGPFGSAGQAMTLFDGSAVYLRTDFSSTYRLFRSLRSL
jgi:hypothetical protein